MNEGFYSYEELKQIGFKEVGSNVLISKKASIYQPEKISIGHDVRIDDFCFIVGNISIGNYIHIAPYASIHGTGGGSVVLKDFTAMASYSTIYAASDDFTGKHLANSMIDSDFIEITSSNIVLEKYCLMGIRSVLLPGAYLAEGAVLAAMSEISKKTKPWHVYFGIPARKVKERSRDLLELEKEFKKRVEG